MSNVFKLKSQFKPAGDQPKAIKELVAWLEKKMPMQTLLGVTGSGKTFTMANVIAEIKRPTLVIAHNKTLAAQLCQEFREFFPENAVHYFISYYDYYQPEAYMPTSDTYIDKESMINDEIDRLRHAATQALLSRRDVIIVASVSCIYGLGEPETYEEIHLRLAVGDNFAREKILKQLIEMQFNRTNMDLTRGTFRLRGDVLEIMPKSEEIIYRLELDDEKVSEIVLIDPTTRKIRSHENDVWIFPAKHFITRGAERARALADIQKELDERIKFFEHQGKLLEVERISRRTRNDMEMIRELGYCHGIENYSRHLSGRAAGEAPATLLDYFPRRNSDGRIRIDGGRRPEARYSDADFLTIIDESHVTVPQIGGMYEGDASRKKSLIEYGFRLLSAADNRPLKFHEFKARVGQMIFTSATPGAYEIKNSSQIVEQIIRPTGLVDPKITVRPVTDTMDRGQAKCAISDIAHKGQIEDLIERIIEKVKKNERVLVTTLTKKMAEDLTDYLHDQKIKVNYIHSEVKALDRIRILTDFRRGKFDVLVGVNLLREGLDLPEVTMVAILDADKEGFLRSETSLIQTIGRAARNIAGEVVLYADHPTGSIKKAISETERRREIQLAYNKKHGITPQTIKKNFKNILAELEPVSAEKILELEGAPLRGKSVKQIVSEKENQMKEAAKNLNFELAAILRDEIKLLKKKSSRLLPGKTR